MTLLAKARALFRAFQDYEPAPGDIVTLEAQRDTALVVGELKGVMYTAKGDGKTYFHRFKANDRPVLMISADGRQAYILAGGYRFTERGFVG